MGKIVNLQAEVPFNFWEGRLFTDELLTAASTDPALWPGQAAKIANFNVNLRNGSLAWQEGMQLAIKEAASASGVPASLAATIGTQIIGLATSMPTSTKDLALDLTQSGIMIVSQALSAIPIVGPIVGAIGGIANLLIDLARVEQPVAEEVLPPLQDYKDEIDEYVINNQVIPALGTLDWTGLFLPRYSGTWRAEERKHGWMMVGASGDGVGFMPGTQRISGIVQTYFIYKSVRKGFQLVEARDQGSFYPSAAQMLTAMQAQVEKPQTQLYNVDTHKIQKRWREYLEAATELAKGIFERKEWAIKQNGLSGLTKEQSEVLAAAFMSPMHVGGKEQIGGIGTMGWKPWSQGASVFDEIIKPWCERVRQRQFHHIGTIVGTAYTDEDQAAFADQELLLKMRINRGLLLNSPARGKVVTAEMIDKEYRQEIFDVTTGGTLTAWPAVGKAMEPPVPDASAEPPRGGAPFGLIPTEEGALGRFLFGAAVLGGAAYGARKMGWI